jgi:hypothetical protein
MHVGLELPAQILQPATDPQRCENWEYPPYHKSRGKVIRFWADKGFEQ